MRTPPPPDKSVSRQRSIALNLLKNTANQGPDVKKSTPAPLWNRLAQALH
jgi:hypothetical protein